MKNTKHQPASLFSPRPIILACILAVAPALLFYATLRAQGAGPATVTAANITAVQGTLTAQTFFRVIQTSGQIDGSDAGSRDKILHIHGYTYHNLTEIAQYENDIATDPEAAAENGEYDELKTLPVGVYQYSIELDMGGDEDPPPNPTSPTYTLTVVASTPPSEPADPNRIRFPNGDNLSDGIKANLGLSLDYSAINDPATLNINIHTPTTGN